jgi:hypothetical protein
MTAFHRRRSGAAVVALIRLLVIILTMWVAMVAWAGYAGASDVYVRVVIRWVGEANVTDASLILVPLLNLLLALHIWRLATNFQDQLLRNSASAALLCGIVGCCLTDAFLAVNRYARKDLLLPIASPLALGVAAILLLVTLLRLSFVIRRPHRFLPRHLQFLDAILVQSETPATPP